MACHKVPLGELPWTQGGHPLERKKHDPAHPVTLLEFAVGFADPNWCRRGHYGLVLEGEFGLEFADRTVRFAAGDAFLVEPGTDHRAQNPGEVPVRIFVYTVDAPAMGEGRRLD